MKKYAQGTFHEPFTLTAKKTSASFAKGDESSSSAHYQHQHIHGTCNHPMKCAFIGPTHQALRSRLLSFHPSELHLPMISIPQMLV